jgi:outer membrane biosynthesis protein TonB
MSARRGVALALLAVTLMVACGDQAEISARARRQLQARLEEVRTAVAAADRLDAQSALRDLERSVSQLLAADQLSDARATEILAAAQDVAAQLSLLSSPEPTFSSSPEPTETTTPTPTEKPDKPDKPDKDEDKDEGKGKGNGGEGHG